MHSNEERIEKLEKLVAELEARIAALEGSASNAAPEPGPGDGGDGHP